MESLPQNKNWFSKHMLLGYLFLGLVFAGVVGAVYWHQYGQYKPQTANSCIEGTRPEDCNDTIMCIQVITPAKNMETGEIKEFPTPCDVPEGWEKIDATESSEMVGWQTYSNTQYGFQLKYPGSELTLVEESEMWPITLYDKNDRQRFNFSITVNNPGLDFGVGYDIISTSNVNIGGVQAEKTLMEVSEGHEKGMQAVMYNFKYKNNGYSIISTGGIQRVEPLIATFIFIN